ncbi:MAG: alpha/beta fold hydrolase [Thermoplasmataceae archaeon]
MKRSTTETRHGEISYLEGNGKIPLILLHGLGGMGNVFFKLSSCLDKNFKLILPDLLGHGHSSLSDGNITVKMQCEAIHDLIENIGSDGVILGGHSYGGWISLKYASTYQNLNALIMLNNAGINPTVADKGGENIEKFLDRVMSVNARNNREVMRQIIINNGKGEEKITDEMISRINIPTLIIWGDMDSMIPIEYGVELSRKINGSKVSVIREGGHNVHYTHYREVCLPINEFLNPLIGDLQGKFQE